MNQYFIHVMVRGPCVLMYDPCEHELCDRSVYTSTDIMPHRDLIKPTYIFFQHYSLPGLEFDSDLDRAQELLFSWTANVDFFLSEEQL